MTPRDRLTTYDMAVGFVMLLIALGCLFLATGLLDWLVGLL